jgi:hypothetical protein
MKRRRVIRLKNKSCSSLSTRRRVHNKKAAHNIIARSNVYRAKLAREAEEDKLEEL